MAAVSMLAVGCQIPPDLTLRFLIPRNACGTEDRADHRPRVTHQIVVRYIHEVAAARLLALLPEYACPLEPQMRLIRLERTDVSGIDGIAIGCAEHCEQAGARGHGLHHIAVQVNDRRIG